MNKKLNEEKSCGEMSLINASHLSFTHGDDGGIIPLWIGLRIDPGSKTPE
jgi:hypothetical protein